jgi:hypothetical protein
VKWIESMRLGGKAAQVSESPNGYIWKKWDLKWELVVFGRLKVYPKFDEQTPCLVGESSPKQMPAMFESTCLQLTAETLFRPLDNRDVPDQQIVPRQRRELGSGSFCKRAFLANKYPMKGHPVTGVISVFFPELLNDLSYRSALYLDSIFPVSPFHPPIPSKHMPICFSFLFLLQCLKNLSDSNPIR